MHISDALSRLIDLIANTGGKPIAVGGCVRDWLLGFEPSQIKDIDLEVYHLSLEQLEQALKSFGLVKAVGASFGVLKVVDKISGETFDVALPRTESKSGQGHRGFVVETQKNLNFAEASSRRDFTVNAMGYDLIEKKLLDPNNGQQDLKNKTLKHVSDKFSEDPLRVLRACQFAARFSFELDQKTLELCKSMRPELNTLAPERIGEEIKKLVLAPKPSIGLSLLKEVQALDLFKELEKLVGCEQNPKWHPEGDVWVHTLMVVDEAAQIIRREKLLPEEALIIMLAALCHDLGKPLTLTVEDGVIKTKGHEAAGARPTRQFLEQCGFGEKVIESVIPLVKEHLKTFQLYALRDKVSDAAIRRLSARVNIQRLCWVSKADFLGRTTEEALARDDKAGKWLLQRAKDLEVQNAAPKAILQGRDLLDLGYKPGPKIGKLLRKAYDAQLEGEFTDKAGAMAWLKNA